MVTATHTLNNNNKNARTHFTTEIQIERVEEKKRNSYEEKEDRKKNGQIILH